jgi:hypothetical protein
VLFLDLLLRRELERVGRLLLGEDMLAVGDRLLVVVDMTRESGLGTIGLEQWQRRASTGTEVKDEVCLTISTIVIPAQN